MRGIYRSWENRPWFHPLADVAWVLLMAALLAFAIDRGCEKWAEGGPVASLPVEVE